MSDNHRDKEEPMEGEFLHEDEAAEEFIPDDNDMEVDSDDDNNENNQDNEEILLQNDSVAYFDQHRDSVFCIAQHPIHPSLIATGGSEGEDEDAPGKGYLIDTSAAPNRPVLPASFSSDPNSRPESVALKALFSIDGHSDSISALAFTLPKGQFLVSGGMDGHVRLYAVGVMPDQPVKFKWMAEAAEVPEVNWISPCPNPAHPHTFAVGASDGSVWVYTISPKDKATPLQVVNTYYLHTGSCTAGSWTPDGKLLATVAEDSSLYVWDVFGEAAAHGITAENGMSVVSLNANDQRFAVDGGLYSLAVDPNGAFVAVGGAGGGIRIISLPRLGSTPSEVSPGGQILASLQTLNDTAEALSFSSPVVGAGQSQITLLAAGCVDGTIAVFDASRRFALRRTLPGAHEDFSVVKLDFVPGTWMVTSCGMDGVIRRWDLRAAADQCLVKEWKGHRGDGEGGGVLGFVQGESGERVISAGDDGLVLVFDA
ncbi:putative WD repeat-containing protein C25H1.08c [Ceratocystis lukuohia]|uniref:WD repeat-containing protein C25H1.08c n=2 Tax=Ceratocystis TaxID=5157 RepID=A0ABR4MBT4_9PEZI|nr:putative WD repeat-containing protein C25H1.08c [Ceratocystis platani]